MKRKHWGFLTLLFAVLLYTATIAAGQKKLEEFPLVSDSDTAVTVYLYTGGIYTGENTPVEMRAVHQQWSETEGAWNPIGIESEEFFWGEGHWVVFHLPAGEDTLVSFENNESFIVDLRYDKPGSTVRAWIGDVHFQELSVTRLP